MAELVRFVFSIGGMSCALLAGWLWSLARSSSRAPRRFITIVILFYALVAYYPATRAAAKVLSRSYHPLGASDVPPGASAIVILGSGSYTARDWGTNTTSLNDPVAAERVIEAVRVFNMIKPEVVVSSGGSVGAMDREAPGGILMKELLVRLGVPETRIQLEVESQNTHDEAVLVKRMLAPLKIQHVVLVTSDVHMWRSVGTFRSEGMDVIPAIARSPLFVTSWDRKFLPSPQGIEQTQDALHEVFGVGYYWLRGWYR